MTNTYDDASRWTATTDWNTTTTSFGYDHNANLTTITYPSGLVDTFTFDNADRLTSIDYTNPTGTWATLDYTRNPDGTIATLTPAGLGGTADTYTYDPLNQLTGVTTTTGTTSYDHDPADNLTLYGATTQGFDDANQLCFTATSGTGACTTPPTGATTHAYDQRGNRTTTTSSRPSALIRQRCPAAPTRWQRRHGPPARRASTPQVPTTPGSALPVPARQPCTCVDPAIRHMPRLPAEGPAGTSPSW